MPELIYAEEEHEALSRVERWWAGLTDEQRAGIPDAQRAAIEETVAHMREERATRQDMLRLARRRHAWTSALTLPLAAVCLAAVAVHFVAPHLVSFDNAGLAAWTGAMFGLIWVSSRTLVRLQLSPDSDKPIRAKPFEERVDYYRAVVRGLKAVGSLHAADGGSVAMFHARAHLDALAQSPDGAALPLVDFLANNVPDPDLQLAAHGLLPTIQSLAERQKAGQVLLRPAEPATDTLLRVPEAGNDALLRPAEGEGDTAVDTDAHGADMQRTGRSEPP